MPKEPSTDKILELVQWIDDKRRQKKTMFFRRNDAFGGEMTRLVFGLVALFFVVWIIVYEYGVSLAFQGLYDFKAAMTASSVLLPALAVVIASLALFNPYLEKNQVEVRYNRALKLRKKEVESSGKESKLTDFTEDEKPLLKALIEIGSKNEGFSLKQLYSLDKTNAVFTKEKLLERLCK
jgi:hypothetical protein